MQEPVFDATATLPGWMPAPQETDASADGHMAWIGGGLALLMWAFVTALAVNFL